MDNLKHCTAITSFASASKGRPFPSNAATTKRALQEPSHTEQRILE
jgi:hypothetical protein